MSYVAPPVSLAGSDHEVEVALGEVGGELELAHLLHLVNLRIYVREGDIVRACSRENEELPVGIAELVNGVREGLSLAVSAVCSPVVAAERHEVADHVEVVLHYCPSRNRAH